MMNAQRRYHAAYRLAHRLLTRPIAWLTRYQRPALPDLPEPYLLIPNHSFELDFALIIRTFPRYTRFVIGETVFQSGLLRKLLFWLHDPVVIQKSGTDMRAILDMLHRLRKGQNICLFAEGDTTFDGITSPIHPGTSMLVRGSGAALVTFRVRGGYFTRPRWGHGYRRGRTWGEVGGVYTAAQLKEMTNEDISALLKRDLHVDADEDQQPHPIAYRGRNPAAGIENLLYLCPGCDGVGTLRGQGTTVRCSACQLEAAFTPQGTLEGAPHSRLSAWARWQRERLGILLQAGTARVGDSAQKLRRILDDHSLEDTAQGDMRLDAQGLTVGNTHFPLEEIAGMAIFRRNRLIFSTRNGQYYDIDPKHAGSALKYRDAYQLLTGKE